MKRRGWTIIAGSVITECMFVCPRAQAQATPVAPQPNSAPKGSVFAQPPATKPAAGGGASIPVAGGSDATPKSGGAAVIEVPKIGVIFKKQAGTLNQVNTTGSKLGLTPKETPASINIINAGTIAQRGYASVQDAVQSAPGLSVGGSPADPSTFSARGFTGDEVSLLRDGIYEGPSDLVNRPENAYNLNSIQILKGPASVIYGQGAVGGVINVITRQPVFQPLHWDALASYGSFNTFDSGLSVDGAISPNVAVDLAFSRNSSSGYVHNDFPSTLNFTGSLVWHIQPTLQLQVGFDYINSVLPSYYGTPLIPSASDPSPIPDVIKSSTGLSLDSATRFLNYNTTDSVHKANTYSPSALLTWEPSSNVIVTNDIYEYYAERRWQNAETYTYIPPGSTAVDAAGNTIPGNSIGRDRFYVYHQQHLYGDQAHVTISNQIFGMTNRVTFGIDGSYLQFIRSRGFPNATFADYTSLLAPDQGNFGNFPGLFPQRQSPSSIADIAGLFEDALDLTRSLKFVTGVRTEWLRLDRLNFNQDGTENYATGFNETLNPTNFRVGLVYSPTDYATLYASYTTAEDPPGSNVLIANAGQFNGLSSSEQEETGIKIDAWHHRISSTLAFYNIDRSNILVNTGPDTVANVGAQYSKGVEFEGDVLVTPAWTVNAVMSYTYSRYSNFVDPVTGLNASGNEPPDVPTWQAAVFTNYTGVAGLPLDVGGDITYTGQRQANYGNSILLQAYTLVDLYATYHLGKHWDVTGRIDNLFNKTYVQWADVNYPTELILGRPRYLELDLHAHF